MTRRKQPSAAGAKATPRKPATPPRSRRQLPLWAQRVLGVLGFGGAAVGCILLGVLDLVRCVEALVHVRATASFSPAAAMTVTLAVAFAMFAAMCTLPDPEIRLRPSRRSSAARMSNRMAGRLFAVVGAACIATPFAPVAADLGLTWLAARHGYVRCPDTTIRHPIARWALKAADCPMDAS